MSKTLTAPPLSGSGSWLPTCPGLGTALLASAIGRPPLRAGNGWAPAPGAEIANEYFEVASEPSRGGGLVRITERASGFGLVPIGEVANELVVYQEYPDHPVFGEGPWHLLPFGEPARSSSRQALVQRETSALGERLVIDGRMELGEDGGAGSDGFDYRQVVTLWQGIRRAELRTEIHGWAAKDKLLRLRFPTVLAGATPVSAVGDAVVARGYRSARQRLGHGAVDTGQPGGGVVRPFHHLGS